MTSGLVSTAWGSYRDVVIGLHVGSLLSTNFMVLKLKHQQLHAESRQSFSFLKTSRGSFAGFSDQNQSLVLYFTPCPSSQVFLLLPGTKFLCCIQKPYVCTHRSRTHIMQTCILWLLLISSTFSLMHIISEHYIIFSFFFSLYDDVTWIFICMGMGLCIQKLCFSFLFFFFR